MNAKPKNPVLVLVNRLQHWYKETLVEPYVRKELARRDRELQAAVEEDIRRNLARGNLSMQDNSIESEAQIEAALQRLVKRHHKKQNWLVRTIPFLREWDARRVGKELAWGLAADKK